MVVSKKIKPRVSAVASRTRAKRAADGYVPSLESIIPEEELLPKPRGKPKNGPDAAFKPAPNSYNDEPPKTIKRKGIVGAKLPAKSPTKSPARSPAKPSAKSSAKATKSPAKSKSPAKPKSPVKSKTAAKPKSPVKPKATSGARASPAKKPAASPKKSPTKRKAVFDELVHGPNGVIAQLFPGEAPRSKKTQKTSVLFADMPPKFSDVMNMAKPPKNVQLKAPTPAERRAAYEAASSRSSAGSRSPAKSAGKPSAGSGDSAASKSMSSASTASYRTNSYRPSVESGASSWDDFYQDIRPEMDRRQRIREEEDEARDQHSSSETLLPGAKSKSPAKKKKGGPDGLTSPGKQALAALTAKVDESASSGIMSQLSSILQWSNPSSLDVSGVTSTIASAIGLSPTTKSKSPAKTKAPAAKVKTSPRKPKSAIDIFDLGSSRRVDFPDSPTKPKTPLRASTKPSKRAAAKEAGKKNMGTASSAERASSGLEFEDWRPAHVLPDPSIIETDYIKRGQALGKFQGDIRTQAPYLEIDKRLQDLSEQIQRAVAQFAIKFASYEISGQKGNVVSCMTYLQEYAHPSLVQVCDLVADSLHGLQGWHELFCEKHYRIALVRGIINHILRTHVYDSPIFGGTQDQEISFLYMDEADPSEEGFLAHQKRAEQVRRILIGPEGFKFPQCMRQRTVEVAGGLGRILNPLMGLDDHGHVSELTSAGIEAQLTSAISKDLILIVENAGLLSLGMAMSLETVYYHQPIYLKTDLNEDNMLDLRETDEDLAAYQEKREKASRTYGLPPADQSSNAPPSLLPKDTKKWTQAQRLNSFIHYAKKPRVRIIVSEGLEAYRKGGWRGMDSDKGYRVRVLTPGRVVTHRDLYDFEPPEPETANSKGIDMSLKECIAQLMNGCGEGTPPWKRYWKKLDKVL